MIGQSSILNNVSGTVMNNAFDNEPMENTSVICKTDAEILLDYVQLKDSGFVFSYAKKEDGIFQKYVNCNGRVYGPYDSVSLSSYGIESAEWTACKGELNMMRGLTF